MNIFSKLTLAAGLMALFAACSTSTSPTTTGNNTVVPKQGSSYSYHTITKDSNNVATDSSNRFDTVLATGITYQGKTNVNMIQSMHVSLKSGYMSMDTMYINYESNGDVSIFQKATPGFSGAIPFPAVPATWLAVGVSSGVTTNLVLFDTTFTYNGTTGEAKATSTISKGAAGSETVGSQSLSGTNMAVSNGVHITTTIPVLGTKVSLLSSDQNTNTLFIPSIGNFGDMSSTSTTTGSAAVPFPNSKNTSIEVLTGYSLK